MTEPSKNPGHRNSDELPRLTTLHACCHVALLGEFHGSMQLHWRHRLGACTWSLLVSAPCIFPFAQFNWDPFPVEHQNRVCEHNSLRVVLENPDTQKSQCLLDPDSFRIISSFSLTAVFQREKKAIFSLFTFIFPQHFPVLPLAKHHAALSLQIGNTHAE